MKRTFKRLSCLLIAAVVLVCLAAPGFRTQAAMGNVVTEESIDPERVLYTFTADDFRLPYAPDNGDGVFEDADSTTGKAAVLSYAKRKELGDKGMVNAMIRGGTQVLMVYSQGEPYVEVGYISITQLQENSQKGGYSLYQFTNVDLMPGESDYFIYIFDCWGFQIRFTEEQKANLRGKRIDFFLSLKVTGNVSDTQNNTPTYYIDKVIIAETDPNAVHIHSFGNWGVDNETHRRICSECGEMESGAHQWDEGVVMKEATATEDGLKVYTCKDCGKTKNVVLNSFNSAANVGGSAGGQDGPPAGIIAVVMIVVALGIVAGAVILLKPKKKTDSGQ